MAQISSMKCNLCSINNGSVFCYECKHALCNPCRKLHDKIPLTKKHKVAKLNKVDRLVFQSELGCETHSELFSLYCTTCNCLICSSCVVSTHKGHSFAAVEEIVRNAKRGMQEFIAKARTKRTELLVTANTMKTRDLKKIETHADEAILKINNMALELHETVDIIKNIYTAEVTDLLSIIKNQLESNVTSVQNLRDEYQNVCCKFEQILNETHDVTFFLSYVTNKNSMDTLEDKLNLTELEQFPVFDIQTFVRELSLRIEEKYTKRKHDGESRALFEEQLCTLELEPNPKEKVRNVQSYSAKLNPGNDDASGRNDDPKAGYESLTSSMANLSGKAKKQDSDSSDESIKESSSSKSRSNGGRRRHRSRRRRQYVDYPDDHKLFVGSIPLEVKETELKTFLKKFGTILDVSITQGMREDSNIAFVTFASADTVQKVLSQEEPIIYHGGHRLLVKRKKPRYINSRGKSVDYQRGTHSLFTNNKIYSNETF